MVQPANVVSLSGGKDSTAMLLMMLERGESIADIVFFDTGWEFPQMHEHLEQLERYIGRPVTRLRPRIAFDYWFREYKVFYRKTKQLRRIGLGWPSPLRRWCTREKAQALFSYCNALTWQGCSLPLVQCVGFAADESARIERHSPRKSVYQSYRYPLHEYGVTEADALQFCRDRGFTWNGLYDSFRRVSCFCCPLQGLDELRTLRREFPDLWARIREMESWLPEGDKGRRFKDQVTISALDARFAAEDAEDAAGDEQSGLERQCGKGGDL